LNRRYLCKAVGILAALLCLFSLSPEPQILQITFLGDVMLGRGIDQAANRSIDWQPFAKLQPVIDKADILAANLESPLTTAPVTTSGYVLCAPPKRVADLKTASFDLVTFANNHTGDCGEAGIRQTLFLLRSNGIQVAGPSPEPVYMCSRGKTLAFISLDDISTPLDLPRVKAIISSTVPKSDLVIISIHWGSEYQAAPSARQRWLASILVAAGADVIVGHHPHIIQPIESLPRENGKPPALVFYSMGNALFDQHGLPDTRVGAGVNLFLGPRRSYSYSIFTFEIDPIRGVITGILP
jgi:poly-gamma-glutamate synthesis protein (capsule biosynthesis protein)